MDDEVVRGSMVWDLPESLQYTPGEVIEVTVTITNPTEEARLYALPWALIQSGTIVGVGLLTDGETDSWWVDGGESKEITFEISPGITNAYFNVSLLGGITLEEEEAEEVEEIIDSLTTYLYSVTVTPVSPAEFDISVLLASIMPLIMLVLMFQLLRPMLKEI